MDHYFTSKPAGERSTIHATLGGVVRELVTARGVFSGERLDPGTRILIEHAPDPHGLTVDVGCGWGPLSLDAALRNPAAEVIAVDVNEGARELTAENAARLGVTVTTATPEEALQLVGTRGIDYLISNPPIRVGKSELHSILATWLPRLAPEGAAYLVVAKNLGADSLQRWIEAELGQPCVRIASQKGYRILQVTSATSTAGPER
ncbi:16S rRNA m(2)G 1207 methyltransferase [Ruaniaceae bacterium KH17]|nr:16S rRNA m(2)G 1207 methyltransferase [Ruaniaceae bacterium KH17]